MKDKSSSVGGTCMESEYIRVVRAYLPHTHRMPALMCSVIQSRWSIKNGSRDQSIGWENSMNVVTSRMANAYGSSREHIKRWLKTTSYDAQRSILASKTLFSLVLENIILQFYWTHFSSFHLSVIGPCWEGATKTGAYWFVVNSSTNWLRHALYSL